LAANNKQITIPVHLTIQFIDGKAVTEYGYWDNAPIVAALQEIEANQHNKQTVQAAYDNFAKGDVPAVLALLDPKAEWNEAENFIYASEKPYIGADAIVKGVFEPIGADWEYWKISDLQLNELTNGMVLATGRYQAKNKKTGKDLNAQVAHVWTLKNGKITKFQQYTDTKQAAEVVN
jgi:ketosteroid isomerase-like protein